MHLILETKGYDPLAEVKAGRGGALGAAVNADAKFGVWRFMLARSIPAVRELVDKAALERPAAVKQEA